VEIGGQTATQSASCLKKSTARMSLSRGRPALPGTNVGGYENTGWDLVANLVGCLIAATAVFIYDKRCSSQ